MSDQKTSYAGNGAGRADVTGFTLGKAARSYVISRLEKADDLCGFEKDLLELLQDSPCTKCRGSGCAPYVGGDDDDCPCDKCNGSGFNPEAQLSVG